MIKTIVFYLEEYRSDIVNKLKDQKKGNIIAIPIDGIIDIDGIEGIEYKKYEDYLTENELLFIDNDASERACTWYKDSPAEQIHWGHLLEYEMQAVFALAFKHICLLEKIQPDAIILCKGNSVVYDTVLTYAFTKKIEIATVEKKVEAIQTKQPLDSLPLKRFLKKILLLIIVRFSNLCFKVQSFFYRKQYRVITNPYPHVNHLIEQLILNSKWQVAIIGIESTFLKKYFGKAKFIPLEKPWGFKSSKPHFKNLLSLKNIHVEYKSVDLSGMVIGKFNKIADENYFTIKNSYKEFSKVLFNTKIGLIILNQDWTGREKVLAYVGKQMGIYTSVIAHGMFIPQVPLVRPISNEFLFWDIISSNYFIEILKVSPKQILLIQNEYLKKIPQIASGYSSVNTNKKLGLNPEKKKILFFVPVWTYYWAYSSPYEPNSILRDVCEVFSTLAGIECIVRLHPSTAHYESVDVKKKIIHKFGQGKICVDPGLPLIEMLNICDLVLGLDTTALLECLFLNIPIIVYNPTGKNVSRFFSEAGASPYITKKEYLHEAIDKLLYNSEERLTYINNGKLLTKKICSGFLDTNGVIEHYEKILNTSMK